MASTLRVQVEQPTRDKKWVAVAVDWPGFERGAKDEAGAIEKLQAYVPRYLPVAKRARLGAELERQTEHRGRRALPGCRIDRLLGHLVRALVDRPAADGP